MPRPPRIHLEGALYHVTSRAMEPGVLFKDHQDYRTYVELLKTSHTRYGFKLFAFVLLPDHLHLCLELTNDTTLSTIMHALNSRYTKYFMKRYRNTGHVFQQRFKATILEKAPSLARVTGYVHTHPRRSGLAGDVRVYPWSSYPSYLATGASANGLRLESEVQELLEQLSGESPGRTYEQYVRSVPEAAWRQLQVDLQRPVVGSSAFMALVEQERRRAARKSLEPTRPGPQPQPQPSGPRFHPETGPEGATPHRRSPALTASVAVAFLAVCAVGLYAKHVTALQQSLEAMAEEQTLPLLMIPMEGQVSSDATARLATFVRPSNLEGTLWDVQIMPMSPAGKTSMQSDQLWFDGRQVVSSQLSAQGFRESNYTLSLQANGAILWETMQTGPSGEVICWRGEWKGRTMRGVLTRQLPGQPVVNLRFVATTKPGTDVRGPGTQEI